MKWQTPAIAIFIGCLTAATFNYLGWLQISERKLYDFYLRSRPQETQDSKIVIVGLNEEDIEELGFPVSDDLLATLLTKIKRQNPRVIGLDWHRNTNNDDPGSVKLNAIFSSTPQLIGVEKTDGGNPRHQSISSATELQELEQTGASEIIEDGKDGIVRRGYLYVQKSQKDRVIPSFSLATALKYLEKENIFPQNYAQTSWLQLDNAVFPLLRSSPLFYADLDLDNYQIIINYRHQRSGFIQIGISDILKDRVEANFFQNKIVFVGTTAETIKDIYTTPKDSSLNNYSFTYGVEIHAHITSQIINSVLNNRTVIKFLPTYGQYFSIVSLLTIAIYLTHYAYHSNILSDRKTLIPLICSISSSLLVLTAGYVCLIWGWWIPSFTLIIALCSSEIYIYFAIDRDELKNYNLKLEQKVREKTQALKETHKKLLSQEKLDLYYKLSCYVAHEIKNKTNIIGLNIQNSQTNLAELKLILEDNAFLFEEITDFNLESPLTIASKLETKISRIQTINQKITLIINEIYNYNQLEDTQATKIDLNQLLDNTLENALQICELKYNNLEIAIARNYEPKLKQITAVASDIERALNNIISNAIYYLCQKQTKQKQYQPRLLLSTSNTKKSIEIVIEDNGIGISQENLERIFQIFWTTKTSGEGMGIGLHFAKELIEKHHGTISVSSVENKYTKFTIVLPTNRMTLLN